MANTHIGTQAMRLIVVFLFCCITSFNGSAHAQGSEILGHWLTEKGDARVLIYVERGMYVGKIVWVKDSKESSKLNTIVLADFAYDSDADEWSGGTVYDPRHGHKASGYLVLKDSKTLKVVGYKAFRWISDTELWTRIDTNTE